MNAPLSEKMLNDFEAILDDAYPKSEYAGDFISVENTIENLTAKVVADEETDIVVCNKNLYNYADKVRTSTVAGITIEYDEKTGYVTINGLPTISYIATVLTTNITDILQDGQIYTLWQEKHYSSAQESPGYLQVVITDTEGNSKWYNSAVDNINFTVDKSNYTYQLLVQTGSAGAITEEFKDEKNRFMLIKGTEDTDFELHKEQTFTGTEVDFKTYDDTTYIYNNAGVNMTVTARTRKE